MEILRQITAKTKGFNIIDSCETGEHCRSAERYIKLYFNKFEDFLGKRELDNYLQEHKIEMLSPK